MSSHNTFRWVGSPRRSLEDPSPSSVAHPAPKPVRLCGSPPYIDNSSADNEPIHPVTTHKPHVVPSEYVVSTCWCRTHSPGTDSLDMDWTYASQPACPQGRSCSLCGPPRNLTRDEVNSAPSWHTEPDGSRITPPFGVGFRICESCRTASSSGSASPQPRAKCSQRFGAALRQSGCARKFPRRSPVRRQ